MHTEGKTFLNWKIQNCQDNDSRGEICGSNVINHCLHSYIDSFCGTAVLLRRTISCSQRSRVGEISAIISKDSIVFFNPIVLGLLVAGRRWEKMNKSDLAWGSNAKDPDEKEISPCLVSIGALLYYCILLCVGLPGKTKNKRSNSSISVSVRCFHVSFQQVGGGGEAAASTICSWLILWLFI